MEKVSTKQNWQGIPKFALQKRRHSPPWRIFWPQLFHYKATSKKGEVSIDADWQVGYKRQIEFYQWLLRGNSFDVSDIGYFVYCNGQRNRDEFNGRVEFDVDLLPYDGNDSWVEVTIERITGCLNQDQIPDPNERCDQCKYNQEIEQYY